MRYSGGLFSPPLPSHKHLHTALSHLYMHASNVKFIDITISWQETDEEPGDSQKDEARWLHCFTPWCQVLILTECTYLEQYKHFSYLLRCRSDDKCCCSILTNTYNNWYLDKYYLFY